MEISERDHQKLIQGSKLIAEVLSHIMDDGIDEPKMDFSIKATDEKREFSISAIGSYFDN